MNSLLIGRVSLAVLLASLSASVVGCSAPEDGDDSSSDESDIKKKVKPKGGNGEFDLVAPTAFKADGFQGSFTFDNAAVKGGDAVQKVPGTYYLRNNAFNTADGQTPSQALTFAVTAGNVVKNQLAGLTVRFAEPLTLGSARVDLVVSGGSGFFEGLRTWQSKPTGSSIFLLAGTISVTPSTEDVKTDYVIAENTLKEVVLPVAHAKVALDAYDSAYPSPTTCATPTLTAGAYYRYNHLQSAPVRNLDGSPSATFVVPAGAKAPVTLNAYGITVSQTTAGGGTNSFTLNRLEVDDVEVAQSGGGSTFVKGTVTIVKKGLNGATTALNCSFPTHSGIDLPDGDYTVTSRASTASGTVTSNEDVSFP